MGNGDQSIAEEPQDGNVLRFTVPGSSRGKGRPRIGKTKSGHAMAFTDKKTISYENLVKVTAVAAGAVVLEGPITLIVTVYVQIPKSAPKKRRADMLAGREAPMRKPDSDNILKIIMDALNTVAWGDDVQVVVAAIGKQWSDNPRTVVTLKRWRPS